MIVAGILLVVLDANPRNDIVEVFTDVARWLSATDSEAAFGL